MTVVKSRDLIFKYYEIGKVTITDVRNKYLFIILIRSETPNFTIIGITLDIDNIQHIINNRKM